VFPGGSVSDPHRTLSTSPGSVRVEVRLHAPEIRGHIRESPSRASLVTPTIELFGIAPDIGHAIQRARAAENLAARPIDGLPVHARLRLGRESPGILRIGEEFADAERYVDPDVPILATGLKQQGSIPPAFGKASRKRAAR